MRVVINEAKVNRNRKISHLLFFASMAGMGVGFFYTWTAPADSTQISCMLLPMLLLMTITSVRMANTWIREPRPVNVLDEALKGLGQKYTIFHYLLPAPHVLIGPEGVFTITPIWQPGEYQVKGNKWFGDGGLGRRLMGYFRQDLIGNPFRDAIFHGQQVQRLVNKLAPEADIKVQPLVVFISPQVKVDIDNPLLPVLFSDAKKKPSLRHYIRDQKGVDRGTLTDEDLDILDEAYHLATRQEIARMLGTDVASADLELSDTSSDSDEDIADSLAEDTSGPGGDESQIGVIYVLQKGDLYRMGIATAEASPEQVLAELQKREIERVVLLRTIQTEEPEAMLAYLEQKFARKKQKEWFGLSKKDVEWLQSLEGELK